MGWIDTNTNFKVKRFLNGQPNVSFEEFKRMAEALFSAIQYDFIWIVVSVVIGLLLCRLVL